MISVTLLRPGTIFQDQDQLFQIQSFKHLKMGRGTANIKVKTKNLRTGAITEKSFISGAKVGEAILEKKEAQYLYKVSDYVFMDSKTFEQVSLPENLIAESAKFLKEGMMVKLLFFEEEPLSLELPLKMDFTVVETGPGIRGDSATNIFKEAILENGLKVKIPLFVKVGEVVRVDTRTGEYQERVKK